MDFTRMFRCRDEVYEQTEALSTSSVVFESGNVNIDMNICIHIVNI